MAIDKTVIFYNKKVLVAVDEKTLYLYFHGETHTYTQIVLKDHLADSV